MRRRGLVTGVLLALLAVPSAALGATPIAIGPGNPADIEVDSTGTAHLAWHTQAANPEPAVYCQLPRGGTACTNGELLVPTQPAGAVPSDVVGRVHVFLTEIPGHVLVFQDRCCDNSPPSTLDKTYVHRSTDGGQSFDPAGPPAGSFSDGAAAEAVYSPSMNIIAISEVTSAGTFVQAVPSFAASQQFNQAKLQSEISGESAIGVQGGRPVAVYIDQDDPNRVLWRRYKPSAGTSASDINAIANWDPEQLLETQANQPAIAMASGIQGVFLLTEATSANADRLFVRRFTGNGWSAPVQISEAASINDADLHLDAGGRLHAVWHNNSEDSLRYAASDNGVNWSPPGDLARGEDYSSVRVAAAADHQGFAVWSNTSGEGNLQAVPLELLPPEDIPGPPLIDNLGIGDSTLAPGQGTSFTFTSSEAGNAVLTLQKRVPGLKLKQKGKKKLACVPRTKKKLRKLRRQLAKKFSGGKLKRKLRKRGCKAWKKVGEIRQAVAAGANTIVFNGRVAGRKLSPGRYRARLVITDATGAASRTETLTFRVISNKKKKAGKRRGKARSRRR